MTSTLVNQEEQEDKALLAVVGRWWKRSDKTRISLLSISITANLSYLRNAHP